MPAASAGMRHDASTSNKMSSETIFNKYFPLASAKGKLLGGYQTKSSCDHKAAGVVSGTTCLLRIRSTNCCSQVPQGAVQTNHHHHTAQNEKPILQGSEPAFALSTQGPTDNAWEQDLDADQEHGGNDPKNLDEKRYEERDRDGT
mmetsp:Transcript_30639/g.46263  ORF Transcript_30639/g.46263 Transcript_30639/m.46263 type:complete len:145 (+) Transcript_30639:145-579(+)